MNGRPSLRVAFDPEAFIDRTAERDRFDTLVSCAGSARVMTIKDGEGTGKSELLRLLHHKCQYALDVPAALVALDELDRVHAAVRFAVSELRASGLDFPGFDAVERRRLDGGGQALPRDARGAVSADRITGGEVAGIKVEGDLYYNAGDDAELQEQLREQAVSAFVEDLRTCADGRPVVLLFDAYDACAKDVERWLPRFLKACVFDPKNRASGLVVVIAGQTVPSATLKLLLGERYDRLVTSVDRLSLWEPDHVADYLDRHGFKGQYDEEDLDWICAKLRKGWTIGQAVDALPLGGGGG